MSIDNPSWIPLQTAGRPTFSASSGIQVTWQRIPNFTTVTGFGFGQGGFGQGGFGGGTQQIGNSIPIWTPYTVD